MIGQYLGIFIIWKNVEPSLADNCYWAKYHWYQWPNIEKLIYPYSHTVWDPNRVVNQAHKNESELILFEDVSMWSMIKIKVLKK